MGLAILYYQGEKSGRSAKRLAEKGGAFVVIFILAKHYKTALLLPDASNLRRLSHVVANISSFIVAELKDKQMTKNVVKEYPHLLNEGRLGECLREFIEDEK